MVYMNRYFTSKRSPRAREYRPLDDSRDARAVSTFFEFKRVHESSRAGVKNASASSPALALTLAGVDFS